MMKKFMKKAAVAALVISMVGTMNAWAGVKLASPDHSGFMILEDSETPDEAVEAPVAEAEEGAGALIEVPDRYNIVLFGLSFPDEADKDRSDSIILCTIDNVNKQLKFTSILRDTKAAIEGHEPQKINAAHQYGGHELALQTINENFGLDIDDYITVGFPEYVSIIDRLGGVTVELSQAEADYINNNCGGNLVEGENHLTGEETLDYSRIRKIDSDVERSGRQRNVLKYLIGLIPQMSAQEFLNLIIDFKDVVVSTSLDLADLAALATIPFGEYEIINNHVPDYDYEINLNGGIDEHGEWVWTYDMDAAGERIRGIIYDAQPVED